MSSPRLSVVAGTRPNFVKLAPLLRRLAERAPVDFVHTGQHYDREMSQAFFDDLRLPPPDINLGVGSATPARQTAQVMIAYEARLTERPADVVLTIGDVNSTLAAALVAAKLHIPVAHVEAGVRSHDRSIPEEVNRVLTDQLSDWLFVPTAHDADHLRREGFAEERIHLVGNVTIDTLLAVRTRAWERYPSLVRRLGLPEVYAVLTLHRPSNVDDPTRLARLLDALGDLEMPIVAPVHPRTRDRLATIGYRLPPRITGIRPLGYIDFVALVEHAALVVTDSGGLPAETTVLGVPCVTVADSTPWPITVERGTNRVAGTDPEAVVAACFAALAAPAHPVTIPLWDGHTAERICDALLGP